MPDGFGVCFEMGKKCSKMLSLYISSLWFVPNTKERSCPKVQQLCEIFINKIITLRAPCFYYLQAKLSADLINAISNYIPTPKSTKVGLFVFYECSHSFRERADLGCLQPA